VIRLAVLLYVKYPLSLRNVEDLLAERGIDISHETVRYWWNRFGPLFASDIRRQRVSRMRGFRQWCWHLDEMYVKVNGEMRDHEGEILESFVTKDRDKAAALKFMKKALKRHGSPEAITTDGLRSYKAAMNVLGNSDKQEVRRWANNRVENSHLSFRRQAAYRTRVSVVTVSLAGRPASDLEISSKESPFNLNSCVMGPSVVITDTFFATVGCRVSVVPLTSNVPAWPVTAVHSAYLASFSASVRVSGFFGNGAAWRGSLPPLT
jgi:putative transposase